MIAAPRMISFGAVLVTLLGSGDARADDTLRCRNGRLIHVGMVDAVVIGRCGEPKSRTIGEAPVLARNPARGTVAATGEVIRTERWIYERGRGQFDAMLTFENGKLQSIELLTEP
jgi:hypothetical protein